MLLVAVLSWASPLVAQESPLGPGLRPPGLEPDVPIDRIDPLDDRVGDSGEEGDDGRGGLSAGWALNAEDVVYSAAKKRQLVTEAPSTVHVITDRQMRRYGWRTLSESLRMVPGVQTRTWLGQFQSVMIRGLLGTEVNNTRILWLENGVPVNDTREGGIWLDQTWPVELVKRIEVVLGPGSSLYGAGAFQGVINIFTRDPRDVAPAGEYRFGYGSHNTLRAVAMKGLEIGDFGLLAFVAAGTTEGPGLISEHELRRREREAGAAAVRNGDSPLDPRYAPQPIAPNSDRTWITGYLKGVYDIVRVSAGVRYVDAGFDGAEFFPSERYQFNRLEANGEVVVDTPLTRTLGLVTLLSYRFSRNDYKDYYDLDLDRVVEIEVSGVAENDPRYPARLDEKVNYVADQHRVFALAQLQWQIIESNELIVGVGGHYEAVLAPDFRTGRTEQDFINGSVFLQDEQRFFDGDLILTAGGRLDTHREFGPQLSFRGAVLYKWTDWLLNRLSYGTAFREPSMSQLYIDHFNAVGTPDLDAETLQNVELSTVLRPIEDLIIRLDAFATFMDNLILNEFDRQQAVPYLGIDGKFVSRQEAAARIFGFEISGRADFDLGFSFFAHYNFLDSRARRCDDCEFEALDYDAQHRAGLGLAWANDDALASLMVHVVGPTRDTAPSAPGEDVTEDASREVAPYVLIQPHARVRLPGDLGALLQASYALSEGLSEVPTRGYYYEMVGVPVPRFEFMLGLQYPYLGD